MSKLLIALIFALVSQPGFSQDCVGVRGLGQATLPASVLLHPDIDGWGGSVYFILDTGEALAGVFSGQDGTDSWKMNVGIGKGGSYTFAFNFQPSSGTYLDTFTTSCTNATFPVPPGRNGLASYQGTHKIVSGTGRFANASGTLLIHGSWIYLGMFADQNITPFGFWNPDITGTICNIGPKP